MLKEDVPLGVREVRKALAFVVGASIWTLCPNVINIVVPNIYSFKNVLKM